MTNKDVGFSERLKKVLSDANVTSKRKWSSTVKMNHQSFCNYVNGDSSPKISFLQNEFLQMHPTVNLDWLITGRGSQFLPKDPTKDYFPLYDQAQKQIMEQLEKIKEMKQMIENQNIKIDSLKKEK